MEASVTLLEATTPVKLPTKQCPRTSELDLRQPKGRISRMAPRKLAVEIPEYIDREALVKKLYTDKKVRDGKLRFVVEKGIGGIVEFEEGVFATPVEEAVARDIIMKMK